MIIIIKKDGQIVTDDGNPIEGKALEGAYMLLADAQDGDSIVYDGTNHMWKAGGSFAPDITDPQNGDTLVYNAAQQKWVNGAGGSGGSVMVVHKVAYNGELSDSNYQLDKTWQEITDALKAGIIVMAINEGNGGATQATIQQTLVDDSEGSTYYNCLIGRLEQCGTESATGYPHKSGLNTGGFS